MRKLEEELALDGPDLLSVDTKFNTISPSPQVSPHYATTVNGNPLVSQYPSSRNNKPHVPHPKSSPVLGVYGREEGYNLQMKKDEPSLKDMLKRGNKQPVQAPMIVQQVLPSPLYVNIGQGNLQKVDSRPLMKVEGVPHVTTSKPQQTHPLFLPNNTKGVTPVILKSTDASFSPVILQSNIISPESQTLMYTSAPIQGKNILELSIYIHTFSCR